jgi:hypothetical protein
MEYMLSLGGGGHSREIIKTWNKWKIILLLTDLDALNALDDDRFTLIK